MRVHADLASDVQDCCNQNETVGKGEDRQTLGVIRSSGEKR
jgi:hypothetical protein